MDSLETFRTIYETDDIIAEEYSTKRFISRKIMISIYKEAEIDAPHRTLISRIISRATCSYDQSYKLTRYLYSLNGARLNAGTYKIGDIQIFGLSLKMLNPLSGIDDNLTRGIELLKEIFLNPLTENGMFNEKYFNEEKLNLINEITDLINDRPGYAISKFIKHMCKNEGFGISNFGEIDDVKQIQNKELCSYYLKNVIADKKYIHFAGEFQNINLESIVNTFSIKSGNKININNKLKLPQEKHQPIKYIEEEKIEQTWLFMGYRHNVENKTPSYGALLVFNAIFGKYSSSKLFTILREKMGLCYYVASSIPSNKNILIVTSAIKWKDNEKFIDKVEMIRNHFLVNEILDSEISIAKKLLLSSLDSIFDSTSSIINTRIEFLLSNPELKIEDLKNWISLCSKDDIVKIAKDLWLDTIYILKGSI